MWGVWYSSGVNEVRGRAMSSVVQLLGFGCRENPIWYTTGGSSTLFVSGVSGEVLFGVAGVLGDIRTSYVLDPAGAGH